MKYALITDIHGNREALDAVLDAIDQVHPDARVVCLGDIVGYGPDPGYCIDLLRERAVPCIRGNHEEIVLGLRNFSRCVSAGIRSARWTRRQLSAAQREFLMSLPISRQVSDELVVCHGDLANADTYISDKAAADTALAQLQRQAPRARVLACGHTHFASLYASGQDHFAAGASDGALDPAKRYVLNPGAVGQSRDGLALAAFAVLDLGRNDVSFVRLAYDHKRTERKMQRADLPGGVVMMAQHGLGRQLEKMRARWERHWGDRENRRLGYTR